MKTSKQHHRLITCTIFILHSPFFILNCLAQDFNDPAKIVEIMNRSSVTYTVLLDKDFRADPPQRGENNTPYTYQEMTDDGPAIANYELDSAVQPLFEEAEAAFNAQDYAKARSKYLEIHELRPEMGVIVTYIGQTFEVEKNYTEAVRWLKKAIDINFHDYMAHWFLADDYYRLRQYEAAAEEIAIAWVLNRNHQGIQERLPMMFKEVGLKYDSFEFIPQYSLGRNGEDIEIRFTEDWMIYAFCKALWQYEPGYHRELGGGRPDFDYDQESECIMNLVIAYQKMNGKKGKDPALNALLRAVENKDVLAFIFMEMWLPRDPIIIYTQKKEAVQELARYVLEIRGMKKK